MLGIALEKTVYIEEFVLIIDIACGFSREFGADLGDEV
jgi:hypothetical protein